MASLRKWQPARVAPQRSRMPERILVCMAAATVGYFVWQATSPNTARHQEVQRATSQVQMQRAERERERAALAEARAAYEREQAERAAHMAKIRAGQSREQAAMFERRYNTDRMPVGSTVQASPAPQRSSGFVEVKPGLPAAGPSGAAPVFGFRELPKWRPQ